MYGDPLTMDLPWWCSPEFEMHYCPGRCGCTIPFEAQLCGRYYCDSGGVDSWVEYVKLQDCDPWQYPSMQMVMGFEFVLLLKNRPDLEALRPFLQTVLNTEYYPWELGFTPLPRPCTSS